MDCVKIQDLILTDHMDGRLAGSLRQAFEEHVAECAACRELMATVRANEDLMCDLPQVAPPPHVWQNIARRVEEGTWWEKVFYWHHGWLTAPRRAVTVAIMVVVVVAAFHLVPLGKASLVAKNETQNRQFVAMLLTGSEEADAGFGTSAEYLLEI